MSVKLIGLKEFNKRSANAKKYAIQLENSPTMVIRDEPLKQSTELAKTTYKYPPPRPRSRYVRTYKLLNSWQYRRIRNGAIISNEAKNDRGVFYPIYVISDWQTAVHTETGWPKRSVKREKSIVKPIFEDVKKRSIALLKASQNA